LLLSCTAVGKAVSEQLRCGPHRAFKSSEGDGCALVLVCRRIPEYPFSAIVHSLTTPCTLNPAVVEYACEYSPNCFGRPCAHVSLRTEGMRRCTTPSDGCASGRRRCAASGTCTPRRAPHGLRTSSFPPQERVRAWTLHTARVPAEVRATPKRSSRAARWDPRSLSRAAVLPTLPRRPKRHGYSIRRCTRDRGVWLSSRLLGLTSSSTQ
jgi:hypothetical protein